MSIQTHLAQAHGNRSRKKSHCACWRRENERRARWPAMGVGCVVCIRVARSSCPFLKHSGPHTFNRGSGYFSLYIYIMGRPKTNDHSNGDGASQSFPTHSRSYIHRTHFKKKPSPRTKAIRVPTEPSDWHIISRETANCWINETSREFGPFMLLQGPRSWSRSFDEGVWRRKRRHRTKLLNPNHIARTAMPTSADGWFFRFYIMGFKPGHRNYGTLGRMKNIARQRR